DAATRAAQEFDVQHTYSNLAALLGQSDRLDALVLATPTDTHHALVCAALDAGLHILCEKPLAFDLAQATAMADAIRQRGTVGKMGFLFRYSPAVEHMKTLVDSGYLGDLQLFESVTVNAQFADPIRPLHWKMQRNRANGGVFVEYGSHSIDLAQWFGGPINSVVAHGVTQIPQRLTATGTPGVVDVDDAATWIATFSQGGEGVFRTGWASLPIDGNGMRLFGSRGALAWLQSPNRRSERVVGATLEHPEPTVLFEFEPPYDPRFDEGAFPLGLLARYNQRLVDSFVADVRRGQASGPSFEAGLRAQEVLAAIRTSLDEHRWVQVERT
ncbi:MAG TPA: Gfo/Idh/MocA family oxidoreductase, partial [Chloroflexota bacterium]|nr:Gfo/Idh/MocA family oxidoreductase [Chloroflexota bacterium]